MRSFRSSRSRLFRAAAPAKKSGTCKGCFPFPLTGPRSKSTGCSARKPTQPCGIYSDSSDWLLTPEVNAREVVAHGYPSTDSRTDALVPREMLENPILYPSAAALAPLEFGAAATLVNPQRAEIMARFKPELSKYYYDSKKFKSYLEQLGIAYPTTRESLKIKMDD